MYASLHPSQVSVYDFMYMYVKKYMCAVRIYNFKIQNTRKQSQEEPAGVMFKFYQSNQRSQSRSCVQIYGTIGKVLS